MRSLPLLLVSFIAALLYIKIILQTTTTYTRSMPLPFSKGLDRKPKFKFIGTLPLEAKRVVAKVNCDLNVDVKVGQVRGNDREEFRFTNSSSAIILRGKYGKDLALPLKESIATNDIPKRFIFFSYSAFSENPSYLCAIESAAKHNPSYEILVFVPNVTKFTTNNTWIDKIDFRLRLVIKKLEYEAYFKGTPLEKWFGDKLYLKSSWVKQNLGNAFRLAILYKIGGIYLDMDIITLNSFEGRIVGPTVAREDSTRINNALLSFGQGDIFLWRVMQVFVWNFQGFAWAHNGPLALTRTFLRDCGWDLLKDGKGVGVKLKGWKPRPYCKTINIASRERFYPIHYSLSRVFVEDWRKHCGALGRVYRNSIGIHWWNKMLKATKGNEKINGESLITKIMEDHCPVYSGLHIFA